MTPERIKLFLRCFYEYYIDKVFEGFEADADDGQTSKLEQYDVKGYFLKNLDIYIENCDFQKEYAKIYNPELFSISKEQNPEAFNELEIFLIENIQLFLHTILEAAINNLILKDTKIKELKIYLKPIDNKTIKLVNIVDAAEKKMKDLNVWPPAMG
ncbi:MAG TPA: hypothetical protein VNB90_04775 [Cytophagaceae bacterium]|jgi:hypothetical protein|nr:hypothetical protein [Cytophagaceae bacterium]